MGSIFGSLNVKGKTIANILGSAGNCEDLSKWVAVATSIALNSSIKVFGSNSILATSSGSGGSGIRNAVTIPVDTSKYYCASAYMNNVSMDSCALMIVNSSDVGLTSSNAITAKGSFIRHIKKFSSSDIQGSTAIKIYPRATASASGQQLYVDGIMLHEITAQEYNDPNYEPPAYTDFCRSIGDERIVRNLLGTDGDCEDISKWSTWNTSAIVLDSTNKVFGSNSIKNTIATGQTWGGFGQDINTKIDKAKYYCLSGYLKNGNLTNLSIYFHNGSVSKYSPVISDTTGFNRVILKVKPSDYGASVNQFSVGTNGVAGQYGYADGLMLTEITAEEYADPNYVPPDFSTIFTTQRKQWGVRLKGKNFIKSFSQWDTGNAEAVSTIVNDSSLQFTRSSAGTNSRNLIIPVRPNTTYTFSVDINVSGYVSYGGAGGYYNIDEMNDAKLVTTTYHTAPYGTANGLTKILKTFTTGSSAKYIRIVLGSDRDYGTFTFNNPQLEEGSVQTTYELYKELSIKTDTPMYSLPSGEADELIDDSLTKKVRRAILDGSLSYVYFSSGTGYKVIELTNFAPTSTPSDFKAVKYDGIALAHTVSSANVNAPDISYINTNGTTRVSVSNADSGWADGYTPTLEDIKAYFMGYKVYDANIYTPATALSTKGATFNGTGNKVWVAITDSTIVVSTAPSTTPAPNYKPYELYYKLSTSEVIKLSHNLIDGGATGVADDLTGSVYTKNYSKFVLTGSLPWDLLFNKVDYKVVRTSGLIKDRKAGATQDNFIGVSYDNTIIPTRSTNSFSTAISDGATDADVAISILNTDSGWGDSYTPTSEEIKAYFNGWRMGKDTDWGALYNGIGGKVWVALGTQNAVSILPTTINPYGYTPYQLFYKPTSPTALNLRESGLYLDSNIQSDVSYILDGITSSYSAINRIGKLSGTLTLPERPTHSKENLDYVRKLVNYFRLLNGHQTFKWTDEVIIEDVTPVKAVHWNDIMTAIKEVYDRRAVTLNNASSLIPLVAKDSRFRVSGLSQLIATLFNSLKNS